MPSIEACTCMQQYYILSDLLWQACFKQNRLIDSQHFLIEKPFSFLSTSCASAAGKRNIKALFL